MIKAAHRSRGRPADLWHIESAQHGWVQHMAAAEVVVTRNGKTGYRDLGVKNGPLRRMSLLERRLQQQERGFLKQIARYVSDDDAVFRLAKHQKTASRIGVSTRSEAALKVEILVVDFYYTSKLPDHQRASVITKKLKKEGHEVSVRRVRQIIRAKNLNFSHEKRK